MLGPADHDDSPTRPLAGPARTTRRRPAAIAATWGPALLPAVLTIALGLIGLAEPAPGPGEELTRTLSALGPAALAEHARETDAVHVFYYLLLHFWTAVAGDDLTALRLPSVIAAGIGVGVAAELGRRLLTPGIGLVAGLLLATLPVISRYAQEAAPYAPALLPATAATLVLYRTLDRPRWWRWTWYALLVALTGLLHAGALLMLGAHAWTVLSRWLLSRQQALFWWFPVTVLSLVPPAPLIALAVRQHAGTPAWRPQAPWNLVRTAPELLFGSAAAGLLIAGLALAARWPDRALVRELAVLAVLPPLLLLGASSVTGPLWAPRHVLLVLPPIALLAAVSLRGLRFRAAVALALTALLALPQHQGIRQPDGHRPPPAVTPAR